MLCPKCKNESTKVVKVFHKPSRTYRYRECKKCKFRFKTVELISDGTDYKHIVERIREIVSPKA